MKGNCGYEVITNFTSELEEFYALESLMNFRDEVIEGKKQNNNMSKNKKSKKVKYINKQQGFSKKKAYKEKE